MDRAEATGKNVNEAIDNALLQLGKSRADVEVQVITEGSRGILGIVGAEDARVLVTVRATETANRAVQQRPSDQRATAPIRGQTRRSIGASAQDRVDGTEYAQDAPVATAGALSTEIDTAVPSDEVVTEEPGLEHAMPGQEPPDQELVDTTVDVVEELLRLLGLQAETEIRSLDYPLTINITGEDLGILIGRRGDTLGSLQFIVNLIVSRRLKRYVRIVVDVEDYRLRREHALRDLAVKAADRVRRSRQPVTLEAMPSNERRIVHLALQGDRFVSTHSIGGGDDRRVVISPRPR